MYIHSHIIQAIHCANDAHDAFYLCEKWTDSNLQPLKSIYIYIHIWMLLVFVGSACILQWNIIIHFSLGPTLSPHIHRWNFSNEWIFRWLEWNEKWRKPKEMEGKRNKNVTHNIFLKWNHYFCCHLDAFMWLHWVWNCRGTSNGHTFIRPTTTL